MMINEGACTDCKAHGAVKVQIRYITEEMSEMKRFVRTSLFSSIRQVCFLLY
jgi:hypothetical protein